tara:strand:+ start:889 stop:1101 length:213 start_codon:yes stop_codon:yes gene_type:complete
MTNKEAFKKLEEETYIPITNRSYILKENDRMRPSENDKSSWIPIRSHEVGLPANMLYGTLAHVQMNVKNK